MNDPLLYADPRVVVFGMALGDAIRSWTDAEPHLRDAVGSRGIRRHAMAMAAHDGIAIDETTLCRCDAGWDAPSEQSRAIDYLNASRHLSVGRLPDHETISGAWALRQAGRIAADPDRDAAISEAACDDLASSIVNLRDVADFVEWVASPYDDIRTKVRQMVLPYVASSILSAPFPVVSRNDWMEEDDGFCGAITSACRSIASDMARIRSIDARHGDLVSSRRSDSLTLRVARLSLSVPVLTALFVARSIGTSLSAAHLNLGRLSHPEMGILEKLAGSGATDRHSFVNRRLLAA